MDYQLNESSLTLYFKGEINSYNASTIQEDVDSSIANLHFSSLILDFNDVSYVSSAGLRIVLRLKQKYNDVKIINASLEVYDVLQMTGFTNIMDVSKKLRHISLDGAQLIGEGYFSYVYRLDRDTIIKVFKYADNVDDIQRELNLAKEAFILGIPTAISFDVVQVDGKYGVIFEMLESTELRDLIRDQTDKYDEWLGKYVALLNKINSTESDDERIPLTKQIWFDKVDALEEYIGNANILKARQLISSIKDEITFVHGDCHFKNILVQKDELLLIDMDTLSRGNRIFEFACLYAAYEAFEEEDPGNNLRFFGVSHEFADKLFKDLVRLCLKNSNDEVIDKIRIVTYIHILWWYSVNEKDNLHALNFFNDKLVDLLPKYNDLNIEG